MSSLLSRICWLLFFCRLIPFRIVYSGDSSCVSSRLITFEMGQLNTYRWFQVTFHGNIPNFVAKFVCSLQSSKVHFRICKPVCKQRLWLAPELKEANQMLSLQTGLWILKRTFELRNEFPNFATKFGILLWKLAEIDDNSLSLYQ